MAWHRTVHALSQRAPPHDTPIGKQQPRPHLVRPDWQSWARISVTNSSTLYANKMPQSRVTQYNGCCRATSTCRRKARSVQSACTPCKAPLFHKPDPEATTALRSVRRCDVYPRGSRHLTTPCAPNTHCPSTWRTAFWTGCLGSRKAKHVNPQRRGGASSDNVTGRVDAMP